MAPTEQPRSLLVEVRGLAHAGCWIQLQWPGCTKPVTEQPLFRVSFSAFWFDVLRNVPSCCFAVETCETLKTVHYHFYGVLGYLDGLEEEIMKLCYRHWHMKYEYRTDTFPGAAGWQLQTYVWTGSMHMVRLLRGP